MGLKKQLGMGVMSAVLGMSLIGGGTYAYFSSSETTNNTFATGTLDLSVDPTTIVDVKELKPGDSVTRDFELKNTGSLDIKNVLLETDYSVTDGEGDNTEDFGDHIQVEFLYNADKMDEVIYETTLSELKDMKPEAVNEEVFQEFLGDGGLEPESQDDLVVKFKFVDNGENQNQFQGDELNLEWTFNAQQGDGEEK
ncbi:cell division protein FtsN [Lentibacillus kapialis]|uniref:Cell division protein FtsN n=1 Tax=Lentibacillus kapialis TaxID=340214 RepID=A0A917UYS7_9BACI|nr:CalY family protein [Lentibacillus kapialis]GGK00238.1 cell division protein FtsN [Lentibacillus kapialis]